MLQQSRESSFCVECYKELKGNLKTTQSLYENIAELTWRQKGYKQKETKFNLLQQQIADLQKQIQNKNCIIQSLISIKLQRDQNFKLPTQIDQNKKTLQQIQSALKLYEIQQSNTNRKTLKQNTKNSAQFIKNRLNAQVQINYLQKQVKEYKIQLTRLIQKTQYFYKECKWMKQFIQSFLKMVTQISRIDVHGYQLQLESFSARQNTKLAWKYLKRFVQKHLQIKNY